MFLSKTVWNYSKNFFYSVTLTECFASYNDESIVTFLMYNIKWCLVFIKFKMLIFSFTTIKPVNGCYRDDIWGHSQYAMNKVKKRKITRKAGGEEVVEEVDAPEEEEEYVVTIYSIVCLFIASCFYL